MAGLERSIFGRWLTPGDDAEHKPAQNEVCASSHKRGARSISPEMTRLSDQRREECHENAPSGYEGRQVANYGNLKSVPMSTTAALAPLGESRCTVKVTGKLYSTVCVPNQGCTEHDSPLGMPSCLPGISGKFTDPNQLHGQLNDHKTGLGRISAERTPMR